MMNRYFEKKKRLLPKVEGEEEKENQSDMFLQFLPTFLSHNLFDDIF